MGTGISCTCLRNDIPVHPHQQKSRRLFFKGTAVSVCQGAPDFTRCAQVEAASSRGCLQKKESTIFSDGAFLERATRLELASRHPTNGNGHSREPCLTSYDFTRCAQVEAASSRGCLQKRKHHLLRWCFSGAGDEARTRYLDLGKVALYQMSYARKRKIDYNPAGGICQPLRSAFFSFFSG